MTLLSSMKIYIESLQNRLVFANFQNIIWIINLMPNLAGFSVIQDKIKPLFWIIHLFLILYVDGAKAATCVYDNSGNAIECYLHVSLFILYCNMIWWCWVKRPVLRDVLKGMEESENLAQNQETRKKHMRYLRNIKYFILSFYACILVNEIFIFMPKRIEVSSRNSFVPCPGLDPVDSMPYKPICQLILLMDELSILITTLCYPALTVFNIAHTASMFNRLTEDMLSLNNYSNLEEHKLYVKTNLPKLIRRYVLIIDVYKNLKCLYSVSIAVDMLSNVLCVGLYFYMSSTDFLVYSGVLFYCFLNFLSYCMLGQYITDASENFERAVYSCGWENFDLREKKLIYLTLIQTQQPVVLLAGDVTPLNMYTFASTLQFVYKFLAIFAPK